MCQMVWSVLGTSERRKAISEKVVPMFHVPDVRATVEWYKSIGFTVLATYGDDGDGNSFAILSFGSGEVMFSSGGQTSMSRRREVDLYVYANDVDDLHDRLKDRVEVVEELHDTFYGMREFIIRDLNRFWITFGQPSVFASLMAGAREGDAEAVRNALERGALKPETLTSALAIALSGDNANAEIRELLTRAGAIAPVEVDADTLESYAGLYKGEQGFECDVSLQGGKLYAALGRQEPLSLMAVDRTTFRPIAFENLGTVTFNVEAGKTTGCAITHGEGTVKLQRLETVS